LLAAAVLASAPLQWETRVFQTSMLPSTLIFLALWAVARDRMILGGVLMGLAAAMKPQLAAPFILYYLLVGRPKVFAWAVAVVVVTTIVAIIPMQLHGYDWLGDLQRNIAQSMAPGGANDPRVGAPWRHSLINLQGLFFAASNNEMLINGVTLLVAAVLVALMVPAVMRRPQPATDLLCLSAVAAIGLLPVYHRLYDAVLLGLPLAWAISRLDSQDDRVAHVTLAILATFLIPLELVPSFVYRIHVFDRFQNTVWWQAVIVAQFCWQLLLVAAWCVAALYLTSGYRATRAATVPVSA
jgi:hypothetical protein